MKAHVLQITPGEFCRSKMYHLEDVNENVTSYGNHNEAHTVRYRPLECTVSLCASKLFDGFN